MRVADDFAAIRARMEELKREQKAEPPRERDGTTWVERRGEIAMVARQKTRELLRRAWRPFHAAACG